MLNRLSQLFKRLNLSAQAIWPRRVGFLLLILLSASLVLLHADPGLARPSALRQINQRGTLIVGVKENLRPLGYRDSQNQLQGLEIEIARQLAIELLGADATVEFKPLLNQDRLAALLNGEVDLLVARLSVTEARLRLVEFSSPYYIDGTAFLTPASSTPDRQMRLGDLRQQSVAVLNGSDTIPTVRSLLPDLRLQGVDSYVEAQTLLDAGAVAAVAADASVLTGLAQENPNYALIPTLISAEALGIAMPKGQQHRDLHQQVNHIVERWQTNGWLRQQIATAGLPAASLPRFTADLRDVNPG